MFQNNKKMPVILGAAVVFAISSNWNYFFKEKKDVPVPASAAQVKQQQSQAKQAKAQQAPQKKTKKSVPKKLAKPKQMKKLNRGKHWGVNPFGLTKKVKKSSKPVQIMPKKKKHKLTNLRLESILITDSQPLAVINNRILAEGDSFMGRKIVKIKEGAVIVEENQVLQLLKLKEHGISVSYVKTSDKTQKGKEK